MVVVTDSEKYHFYLNNLPILGMRRN